MKAERELETMRAVYLAWDITVLDDDNGQVWWRARRGGYTCDAPTAQSLRKGIVEWEKAPA